MRTALSTALAVTLAATTALAADPLRKFSRYGTVINGLDLSASRSFSIDLGAVETAGIFGLATIWVCQTDADNSVSALNLACTASYDNGTTDYTDQDTSSVSSGVATSNDASWTKNPGANTTCWPWRWDIEGYPQVECTFTDTGGDASDTITVKVSFSTK